MMRAVRQCQGRQRGAEYILLVSSRNRLQSHATLSKTTRNTTPMPIRRHSPAVMPGTRGIGNQVAGRHNTARKAARIGGVRTARSHCRKPLIPPNYPHRSPWIPAFVGMSPGPCMTPAFAGVTGFPQYRDYSNCCRACSASSRPSKEVSSANASSSSSRAWDFMSDLKYAIPR